MTGNRRRRKVVEELLAQNLAKEDMEELEYIYLKSSLKKTKKREKGVF